MKLQTTEQLRNVSSNPGNALRQLQLFHIVLKKHKFLKVSGA